MFKKSKQLINKFLRTQNYEIKQIKRQKEKIQVIKRPITNFESLSKLIFYRDTNIVFKVPIQKSIYGSCFFLNTMENPMSLYLKYKNKKILKNFYERFRPKNLIDALKISKLTRSKPSTPLVNDLLKYHAKQNFRGIYTLGFNKNDGHILNGPISERLLNFEYNRIDNLYESIKTNGWKPKKFKTGFIRGIFLIHKKKFLFHIIGGNHRAAVMSSLKSRYLECWFQPNEPRFVSSNFFKKNSKELKLFKLYFDNNLKKKRKKFVINLLNN